MGGRTVVGRDRERERITDYLRPGADARHRALVIVGDEGIGKSALWAEGVDQARAEGARVLTARPVECERDLSYAVLGDLLACALTERSAALPPPQRRALEAALLVGELPPVPADALAIGLAVTTLLNDLGRCGPVLVAVDGLQDVDPASAAALAFALRRLGGSGAPRVLATARMPWCSSDWGWAGDEAEVIRLCGLPLAATQQLLTAAADRPLSHLTIGRIHDRARGNPALCLDLLGALDADGTGFRPSPELSSRVLHLLAGLSVDARRTLLLCAVEGRSSPAQVRAALGRPVAEDLAAAAEAGLIELDAQGIWFRHPLYAEACAMFAGAEECRRSYGALAAVSGDTEQAARLRGSAATGPDATVAAELDRAAVAARQRGATRDAVDLAELAVRLTAPEDRGSLTHRTTVHARYLAEAGDTAAAEDLLRRETRRAAAGSDRCRALLAASRIAYEAHGVEAARALCEQGLAEAGADPILRSQALLASAECSQLAVGARRTLAVEALTMLRGLPAPPPDLLAQALREVALAGYHLGEGMSRTLMHEAIDLERRVSPPPAVAWRASTILGECLKYVDEYEAAGELLRAAEAEAVREGDAASLAELLGHRSELALWQGDWPLADRLALGAVASARQTGLDGRLAMALHFEAMVAVHRGEVARGRAVIDAAAAAARRAEDDWVQMLVATDAAFLDLSLGDLAAASRRLTAVDRAAGRQLLTEPRQWRYLGDHVQLLAALGETATATDRLGRLRQWGDRAGGWGQAMACRASAHVHQALGDADAALADFDLAEHAFEALGLPFPLARSRFERGSLLRRTGHRRAARESLAAAHAGFVQLGAQLWVGQCAAEQARLGGRTPLAESTLTAAEEAVARVVARGATNKQVASALSISPRTVEVHLGRIFRKLGVHTRAELAARYR